MFTPCSLSMRMPEKHASRDHKQDYQVDVVYPVSRYMSWHDKNVERFDHSHCSIGSEKSTLPAPARFTTSEKNASSQSRLNVVVGPGTRKGCHYILCHKANWTDH